MAKEGFFSTVANVQELRNWMRHIPQRIRNYRLIHKKMPPILGALSFSIVVQARVPTTSGDLIQETDCIERHTVILINTAIERASILDGEPMRFTSHRIPIDHIFLQAFGILLPLQSIVGAMSEFADLVETGVQRWLDDKIPELTRQGIDTSDLTKPVVEKANVYRMIAHRD